MTIPGLPEELAWGDAGGLALSMIDLVEDLARTRGSRRSRDPAYWVSFAFRPLLGLVLVLLYIRSDSVLNAFSAFGTGLAGPSLLQLWARKAAHAAPPLPGPTEE